AALDSRSHYQRTKAEAEKLLLDMKDELDVTVFRPSTMFGEHDTFINRFAKLLGQVPVAFPLACADAKFAPVYVKDVAEAFARALDDPHSFGRTFELCGPDVLSLQEIVEYVRDLQHRRKPVVPLPDFLAKAQAHVFEFVPGKPFSLDNYRSMLRDNVCAGENGLHAFGIHPTGMDAVVPYYLTPRRSRILDRFRRRSGGFPRV
ncbi:MAG TPA: NAD-dependent epimerase/dehydratase family protein, partial [Gammaproteobacteria bacterium]